MKTLLKKLTKNIILPLVITCGIYGFSFSQTANDSLIKFNLENKKVYKDFKKFIKKNGVRKSGEVSYNARDSVFERIITFFKNSKPKYLSLYKFNEGYLSRFIDQDLNGMYKEENSYDSYIKFKRKENAKLSEDFQDKISLEAVQEYRKDLIQIMREGGHKKYKNY